MTLSVNDPSINIIGSRRTNNYVSPNVAEWSSGTETIQSNYPALEKDIYSIVAIMGYASVKRAFNLKINDIVIWPGEVEGLFYIPIGKEIYTDVNQTVSAEIVDAEETASITLIVEKNRGII